MWEQEVHEYLSAPFQQGLGHTMCAEVLSDLSSCFSFGRCKSIKVDVVNNLFLISFFVSPLRSVVRGTYLVKTVF